MNGNVAGRQPRVFVVDDRRRRQVHPQWYPPRMEPGMAPCWTFPPAPEKRRSWGCGSGSGLATILVMLLALVFAALGLGAYQIQTLQSQLLKLTEDVRNVTSQNRNTAPQKQIRGRGDTEPNPVDRVAAHLTVNTERPMNHKMLQWEQKHGRVFTKGVLYRNGGIQVSRSGLYFIYSRLDILNNQCNQAGSFLHTLFLQRKGLTSPMTLMQGHKENYCRQTRGQVWTLDSYLGAVLELKEEDWVYVNVTPASLVVPGMSPHGNYFGLYQIV